MIQVANLLKIKKQSLGWLLSMVCIAYWICRGWSTGFMSQSLWHGVSFTMATNGFYKWRNNEVN